MALADTRWQRTSLLCALYVAQGAPWGFMTIAVVSFLTSKGISIGEAGALSAWVLLPWTFKLIWAPVIDSVTIRSMGRRRSWIIGAEVMMALTLLTLLGMGDLTTRLPLLGAMFFLHNCFASLQDVATDALAVDILPHEEQAVTNGLMWGSKLVGKGAGAAAMAWVMVNWSFSAAVWLQFGLLMVIMAFPLCILERPGEKRFPWSSGQAAAAGPATSVRSPIVVVKDMLTAFSLRTTAVFAVFAATKLIGSGVNEIVTKVLYTQELGWGPVEYSSVAGFYVIGPTLVGALASGFLANRLGRRTMILFGVVGFSLTAILFAANPQLWGERWFATTYLLASEGLLAVASVGFLSLSMRISWSTAAASVFTTFMTLSNVGHVIGNWIAGPVQKLLGGGAAISQATYEQTFWFVGIATLIPIALLPLVDVRQVDRAKSEELAS